RPRLRAGRAGPAPRRRGPPGARGGLEPRAGRRRRRRALRPGRPVRLARRVRGRLAAGGGVDARRRAPAARPAGAARVRGAPRARRGRAARPRDAQHPQPQHRGDELLGRPDPRAAGAPAVPAVPRRGGRVPRRRDPAAARAARVLPGAGGGTGARRGPGVADPRGGRPRPARPAVSDTTDAPTTSELPRWFEVLAWTGPIAMGAVGLLGLLLAILGVYSGWLALVLGVPVAAATVWGLHRVRPRDARPVERAATAAALAAVALALGYFAFAGSVPSQNVFTTRDPGVYLNTARWLSAEGELGGDAQDP